MPRLFSKGSALHQLNLQIELMRHSLNQASEWLGLQHPTVLKLSQRLDELICEFYRLNT
jgi:hypothetical protein